VQRVGFALALFHFILGALLIGVNDSRSKRAAIQNGYVERYDRHLAGEFQTSVDRSKDMFSRQERTIVTKYSSSNFIL
jgi:hypothetical protein